MATLLDSLTSLATPAVGQIAQRLGESDAAVARGLETSFASVLGGIAAKSRDVFAMGQVFDLASDHTLVAKLGDVQSMVGGLGVGVPTHGPAGSLLTTLFGARSGAVGDLISRTAGFRNPSSGSSLLGVAAPLVLGLLGRKIRDNGANVGALTSLLVSQRDALLAAAPAGLPDLVDTGPTPPVSTGEMLRGLPPSKKNTAAGAAGPAVGRRWLWPALGAAALALIWFVASRGPATTVPAGTTPLDSAAARAGTAVKSAAGDIADVAARLGAFGKRMLPDGVELNIPERGIESQLIGFIVDRSRPVNDTTWFNFDRLNFATGSATILPASQEQLNNITAVLKAYPNVNVKIGGYTDNTGDAAANLRLSQARADAVMNALVADGIDASRMRAEGYGDRYPVGDNATEEGRAVNRRIALRVTKK
jgi:outer membrane protein OmpA-like peptidoglycan-associated protein